MNAESKRIVYVDIMRAFAVIMMIQGHTVDTLLANEYRTMDSTIYSVWHTLRGFTAPIFMFTAGLVFTYLLKSDHFDFLKNPRIKKGFKRGLLLIGIGYLLRYPTYRIFDFTYVSQSQWDIFYTVDALHLIGLGMLVIIFSVFLSRRMRINLNLVLYSITLFLLMFSSTITKINWIEFLPQFFASYLTSSYGSLFPVFPWLIYVVSGAILGNYLYRNNGIYLKKRFSFSLSTIGIALIFVSTVFFSIQNTGDKAVSYWFHSNGMIFLRVGYVVLLNGIMAFIVRKYSSIPVIIKDTGKKTLLLYVLHVVILYGCAWFPGVNEYYGHSFSLSETVFAVLLMMTAMFAVVKYSGRINIFKNRKIALNRA